MIVDTVSEVREIPAANIAPAKTLSNDSRNRYVCGFGKVGNEVKILLDAERLLFDESLEALASQAVKWIETFCLG